MKKVLVGTVTIDRDVEMYNNQFQYAASFEQVLVRKGTHRIYAYECNLKTVRGRIEVEDVHVEYKGTVIGSNVGGKPGDGTTYSQFNRGYVYADHFLHGRDYRDMASYEYELRQEWEIKIHDFVSSIDGRRIMCLAIEQKDGTKLTYVED